jgi:hypothetical protein
MTPAKRSRARAQKSSAYEAPDEFEFSNLRAGPSGSRRSSNGGIRLVQPAPIARGDHGGSRQNDSKTLYIKESG